MKPKSRSWWALALVLAVSAGACGSGGGNGGKEIGSADAGEISRSEPGHLRVRASGDVNINFDADVPLRIVVIRHEQVTAVRFLSVGIEQLRNLPGAPSFRIAFDLAGAFDGKGTYELPAVGGSTTPPKGDVADQAASAAAGVSKPYLIYAPLGDPAQDPARSSTMRSFENALKPCHVNVTQDDGGAGTLECPSVTDAKGKGNVRFTMEWETK